MKISVIIIHWNRPDLLEKQLQTSSEESLEIIVIDNASDKPITSLEKKFPHVSFIKNEVNRGFAFACNQGSRASQGEWILFLNPDVEITFAQINSLYKFAGNQKLSAVSPLFDSVNYQKPVPTVFSILAEFTPLSKILPLSMMGKKTLVGGCLLVKKTALEAVSGWDERFFLWFEDSDLTRRLQNADFAYDFLANSFITHLGGASISKMNAQVQKDLFFHALKQFAEKHFALLSQKVVEKIGTRFSNKRLLVEDEFLTSSIVVPNIKAELLHSFLLQNYKYFNFKKQELIVVTSTKPDNELRTKFPEVIFIYLRENNGFAHTVNTGFQRARGKYLGTVNDDVILNKGWLEKLEEKFDTANNVGSVSPLVLKPNQAVESLGVNVFLNGRANVQTTLMEETQSDAFNAAAVLFSRVALEEVGLFDERFESYLEDIDLGLRLSRNGWRNIATSASSVTHLGQQTSQSLNSHKNWLDVKNWWLVLLKNYTPQMWLKNLGPILVERARNISGYFKALS